MRIIPLVEYANRKKISRIAAFKHVKDKKVIAFRVGGSWLILQGKNNIK